MSAARPKEWKRPCAFPEEQSTTLAKAHQLHPTVAEILLQRGYCTPDQAEGFLHPDLHRLHDPWQLRHMKEAVRFLVSALKEQRRVVVLGDYDVDGVTGTALLLDFFASCGFRDLDFFIPNRMEHGYGLTPASAEAVAALRPEVVVTVDNGITAGPEAARLEAQGIAVVITDHHLADPSRLPQGLVLNPNHPDCPYPFKKISGCGVALKLTMALRQVLREEGWWSSERPEPNLLNLLDLAALGTVADVVPLVDENRILVHHGLKVFNQGTRLSFQVLRKMLNVDTVTAQTLGWKYGPRINAIGRLGDAAPAVKMLLSREESEARELALQLESINQERRELGEQMFSTALELAAAEEDPRGLVLFHPDFHEGVNGIVASRLVERFHCPVVILSPGHGVLKGSGRSIPELHLKEVFDECAGSLQRYGGHAAAAGCSLLPEHLDSFREHFAECCQRILPELPPPRLQLDGALELSGVQTTLVEQLALLEPFGEANPEPLFAVASPSSDFRTMKEVHVKWEIDSAREIIGWNYAPRFSRERPAQLAVALRFNEFRGQRKIQFLIQDAL